MNHPQESHIEEILNQVAIIPPASQKKLLDKISEVRFSKGHLLLKTDSIEKHIYFIKKGIVRAYAPTPDADVTFWFGKEGQTIISMRSYVENKPSYETIELLEDCELYQLDTEVLHQLYDEDIHIANWGRKFAEQELIKVEERLIQHQFLSATERYLELLKHQPDLIQRIQLGHIASYLGITQVSLSRIRAEIK